MTNVIASVWRESHDLGGKKKEQKLTQDVSRMIGIEESDNVQAKVSL